MLISLKFKVQNFAFNIFVYDTSWFFLPTQPGAIK